MYDTICSVYTKYMCTNKKIQQKIGERSTPACRSMLAFAWPAAVGHRWSLAGGDVVR
jgi:hypothetical protein